MENQQPVSITLQSKILPADVVQEIISEIEAKHDLLKYQVDGWSIWPLFRISVAMALAQYPVVKREHLRRSERLAIAIQDLPGLLAPRKARYVIQTYSSARAEQQGTLYKDIYFDDLLSNIGNYFKIESLNNRIFVSRNRAALIKSDLTTSSFELISGSLARISCPKYIQDMAESLSVCIQNELGPNPLISRKIKLDILRFCWSKKLYSWLLSRICPAYLLVADPGEYDIVAAAKERGIKVIEFQHGFVNRCHPSYSWSTYALKYKEQMPIPDRLFLYGEHWRHELADAGFWGEALCSVGSMRMDQYRKNRIKKKGLQEDCIIVLTSQGTDTEKLIAFISDFLAVAEGKVKFHLYIKLHPVYETSKELYEAAFRTKKYVHILLGSEPPATFELLTQAHLHVSIASTCHYEALGLSVPTVILPLAGYENVLHLYIEGHAFLAQTPQDLFNILLQSKHSEISAEVSEYYFKPNALENIKRELRCDGQL